MTDEQPVVRIERTIPAPPHEVYRAWLEPELMRRWLAPASFAVTRVEVDEREGGRYRIWQRAVTARRRAASSRSSPSSSRTSASS
jgi:uncharacterized protein YndB with AHSA1/START domain